MGLPGTSSNKAKIARRVIEVLDYFDEDHREATVMDIVRRYDRPQSSTSELLSSLVELGLLSKDPYSRAYRLTARAAMLGVSGQPRMLADGSLARLLDRLVAQTGLSVGLFSMVGLDCQIISWRRGRRPSATLNADMLSGIKAPLTRGAPGWLLLSAFTRSRLDGMIRRLNAEAPETEKFVQSEMLARIEECAARGHALGPAGFGPEVGAIAMPLPADCAAEPLVVAIIHDTGENVNADTLLRCIAEGIDQCLGQPRQGTIEAFPNAA